MTAVLVEEIVVRPSELGGTLSVPQPAHGVVLFAHGSGSSRFSPRNTAVAKSLNGRGIATLLFDLLTIDEAEDRRFVFDVSLLAERLIEAVNQVQADASLGRLPVGLFGASTGAAAALIAASQLGSRVGAVVSRGGRPDLAGPALGLVAAPTLLIVGGADFGVIELNEQALSHLRCEKRMELVAGATHLFEEPGALERVMALAGDWFDRWLSRDEAG